MRSGVTGIVTLLTLLILSFILVRGCAFDANEKNALMRDELYHMSHSYGIGLENEAEDNRVNAVIEADAQNEDVSVSLYQADGSQVYSSETYRNPVAEEGTRLSEEKTEIFVRQNAEGIPSIYAIYHFEDGEFLIFTRSQATAWSEFTGNKYRIFLAVFIVLFGAYGMYIMVYTNRSVRLSRSAIKALDEFADGKFEKRIELIGGAGTEVERYNEVLNRIQARIYKQSSRTHALNVVMTQMQNGIIAVDQDLNVILITPIAKKLLGVIGNAEGKPIDQASKDVKLDDVFRESMHQGGVYTNEVAARTAQGRGHRPLRLYVSPMQNEGQVVGALAMVEDITEIRRLERIRTDFAANVSHELKTPLTSIRGFVETLEAGAIDNPPMAHKFLKIIMLETERLTRLINDILSISKLESGDDEVSTQRLRLDKMAYDVADMLTIHAGEKEVTVNCHMNDKPVYIIGNPDRVEQMLINLTENAIKYNQPGGSVTVQVFINGSEANLAVSDTGIGIAEENLPRLFERFYRVDKGRSRQMGGTGLGLAIVKHIVKSMHGEIEVHSKLGEGTEFLVTLPLAEEPREDEEI